MWGWNSLSTGTTTGAVGTRPTRPRARTLPGGPQLPGPVGAIGSVGGRRRPPRAAWSARGMLRRLRRRRGSRWPSLPLLWVLLTLVLESLLHQRSYAVPKPDKEQDGPFYTGCQLPPDPWARGASPRRGEDGGEPLSSLSAPPPQREKAALVMLARNSELEEARHTLESVERHFNRWFHYPVVFLNDVPFDSAFIEALNATVSGEARFEVIPHEEWSFPPWVDPDVAKASIAEQGASGVSHGGLEGYHHMCRFYSGKFYTLEALKEYKWYWRLEPDVDYTCSITYDPFVEMARRNKKYGFTIALWEEPDTCPSLFRHMADWRESRFLSTKNLWRAMVTASWLPFPFRRLMAWLPYRDRFGDKWTGCHYWSNFEIADMDFFRGSDYQDLFEHLDSAGGFYYERWGDAPVHSLAVAMLLDPSQVHHFEDFGYRHDRLYQCPANAPGRQLEGSHVLGDGEWAPEIRGGVGCRCECDGRKARNHPGYCLNRLTSPNSRKRPWFTWFL